MSKRSTILTAATKLFAKRSYDAVGIRDIAQKAHANSSMISYHFGGKAGLLLEIVRNFTKLYLAELGAAVEASENREEFIDVFVRRVVSSVREHRDTYLVGFKELYSHDAPGLEAIKEEFETNRWLAMATIFKRAGKAPTGTGLEREIIFKAVSAMIFSDYLAGDGLLLDNEELSDTYVRVISELIKNGTPRPK